VENNRNTEESHDASLRWYQEKNLADNVFLLNKEIQVLFNKENYKKYKKLKSYSLFLKTGSKNLATKKQGKKTSREAKFIITFP
jgi:hypothetical protein